MGSDTHPLSEVDLQLINLETPERDCQTLAINLLKPGTLIGTEELQQLNIPPELDLDREVILFGAAPTWLYSHLVERFREAAWVGCYNVQLKAAVVVSSRVSEVEPGDIVPIVFNNTPGQGILIGGPPSSGKSVMSNALRVAIAKADPDLKVFLHRANWDGEGNHTYETADLELVEKLRQENNVKLHQKHPDLLNQYFKDQARATENIRQVMDLVLVDVGGKPESVKLPVIEQCSHYIIISKDPEQVQAWHDLCDSQLKPLTVIHSVLAERLEVLQIEPFLEIVAGPWLRERSCEVPEVLLQAVSSALKYWR